MFPDFRPLPRRLPLWTRIRLFFRSVRVGCDLADPHYVVLVKELDGVHYVVGEHRLD